MASGVIQAGAALKTLPLGRECMIKSKPTRANLVVLKQMLNLIPL
jgi:hypothetical protein